MSMVPAIVSRAEEVPEVIRCTALGDSIAKGYAGRKQEDLRSYPLLAAEEISEETGIPFEYVNYAKNGLDSERLNTEILSTEEVTADIEKADILTLTIGANDLMQEFKYAAREVLGTDRKFSSAYDAFDALQEGVESNPLLIVKILDVLDNWDYDAFEERWITAMEIISRHRKESSQFIVTDIYNPVGGFELPGTMNAMVEEIIWNMNQVMYQYAEEYDYRMVDLFESEICGHTQEDGLHPDQEGQNLIARLVREKIDTGRFLGEPEKEVEEEARPEKTVRRRSLAGDIRRMAILAAGAVVLCIVIMIYVRKVKRKRTDDSAS